MKYHVNPKTGRPNKCTASVRACPVGGEHYESLQAAKDGIEDNAAKDYDTVQEPLKKSPVQNRAESAQALFNSLSPEDQAELLEMLAERKEEKARLREQGDKFRNVLGRQLLKLTDPESCRESLQYALREYAQSYNPGCSGCDGSRGDYCRCRKYKPELRAVNSTTLAKDLYSQVASEYLYDIEDATNEQREVIENLGSMMAKHGLDRSDIYEAKSTGGYYGDELRGVEFTTGNETRFRSFHRELLTSLGG